MSMVMEQVIWHGSDAERDELLAALTRNCTCDHDKPGSPRCAGHQGLVDDQAWLDRLVYARRMAKCWTRGEWMVKRK